MPRYFDLVEAESVLPKVQRFLEEMKRSKLSYEAADQELTKILQRVALTGGMVPPRERVMELRSRKEASGRTLKQTFEQFEEIGCLLKDIDTGLVDFPTFYKGKEVYLCWKSGEPGITFWHRVEDGFAGRKPIDDDFRANHKAQ